MSSERAMNLTGGAIIRRVMEHPLNPAHTLWIGIRYPA
jgi:hypothetical protein